MSFDPVEERGSDQMSTNSSLVKAALESHNGFLYEKDEDDWACINSTYWLQAQLRINKLTQEFELTQWDNKVLKGKGSEKLEKALAITRKRFFYAKERNWSPPVCRSSLEVAQELKAALEKNYHFKFTIKKYNYYMNSMGALHGYVPEHLEKFKAELTGFAKGYAEAKGW